MKAGGRRQKAEGKAYRITFLSLENSLFISAQLGSIHFFKSPLEAWGYTYKACLRRLKFFFSLRRQALFL
jgi:hypothetical protein